MIQLNNNSFKTIFEVAKVNTMLTKKCNQARKEEQKVQGQPGGHKEGQAGVVDTFNLISMNRPACQFSP